MGQTGRRSITTHILAVKIASAEAHLHGFGVARQGPWVTSVNRFVTKGGFESSRFYKRPSDTLLPEGDVSSKVQVFQGYVSMLSYLLTVPSG
jgi:hypothetical protein